MADIHKGKLIAIALLLLLFLPQLALANYGRSYLYFRSKCSNAPDQISCEDAGCSWWDDSCHPFPAVVEKEERIVTCLKILEFDKTVFLCVRENGSYVIMYG